MQLLGKIFDSPEQILEKTEREKETLLLALETWNEREIRNAVFNFSVSAYHIVDWVKAFYPKLEKAAYSLLNDNHYVSACRDLCNASKHIFLELEKGPYKCYPPVVRDVEASATSNTTVTLPSFRLKVQFADGLRLPMETVAVEACKAWQEFFCQHGIITESAS